MIQLKNLRLLFPGRILLPTAVGITLLLLCQCKNEGSKSHLQLFGKQKIVLLDSTAAATAIITDEQEHFFDKITVLDMCLQLQKPYSTSVPRDSVLQVYRQFLQTEVMNFSAEETQWLEKIFADIQTWCNKISPDILPKEIRLIKIKGQHYGDGVYYTRENCIMIPANELRRSNLEALREVLIHEVFHVYSRLNINKRNALYDIIGFKKLNGELILPSPIQTRLLLNPDGIDIAYYIRLAQQPGDTLQAAPIITANAPTYIPERKNYFDYINFNVYPIQKEADNRYFVIASTNGASPLSVNEQGDFFKQIKDNTMYIIHPDEIMADNFKFLVLAQSGEPQYQLNRFSQEGQQLLKQMETILQEQ
ncbi:MAG: hypothetical protein ACK4TA_25865 [Saprospiraceae bacterium]